MFSPRVLNPFTCTKETEWGGSLALALLLSRRAGWGACRHRATAVLVTCLRSGCRPVPRKSCRTDRPCTLTVCGSAGLRSYSTNPACCHSCRSSDLDGSRGCTHCPPRPWSHCPPAPLSKGQASARFQGFRAHSTMLRAAQGNFHPIPSLPLIRTRSLKFRGSKPR